LNNEHLWRICADLRDTHDSHLAMPLWQLKSQLPSARFNGIIDVMDGVRSLLQWLRKSYKALYHQQLCNELTMIPDMITGIMIYRLAGIKIVEQRSQIVWQLRKGSTITLNILKWLAGTIRDYHCQLSSLAPI
jgi:hypothetical protein